MVGFGAEFGKDVGTVKGPRRNSYREVLYLSNSNDLRHCIPCRTSSRTSLTSGTFRMWNHNKHGFMHPFFLFVCWAWHIYGAISGRIHGTIYGTINLSIHQLWRRPSAASTRVVAFAPSPIKSVRVSATLVFPHIRRPV